jgi:nanoRNase/pAp phosphatase (c-di-AMP/oligoRNAs hydrolase)
MKRDLVTWDGLSLMTAEEMAFRGEAILTYQETIVDALCRNARETWIGGHTVLAVNSPVLQSEIGERLAKDAAFGAVWFVGGNGETYWSLRSRPPVGIDVSEVAKKYGGGGHVQAAGFKGAV